jgi:hypothetical protein
MAVPDLERRRVIDSDLAKRYLAQWCVDHGVYVDLLATVLPDGRSLQPLGLSPLLQTVSTDVFAAVRHEAFASSEDVVLEATLSSPSFGERLVQSLFKAPNYTELFIVSAETNRSAAHQQARSRWWEGRDTDPLGGRMVTPAAIDSAYGGIDAISVCRDNAIALLKLIRSGQTGLQHASMIAYNDGELAFADNDPPRVLP